MLEIPGNLPNFMQARIFLREFRLSNELPKLTNGAVSRHLLVRASIPCLPSVQMKI
jgi:hypothetical protein